MIILKTAFVSATADKGGFCFYSFSLDLSCNIRRELLQ